eukprot:5067526-Prymnesium_polylepis.1
MGCAWGAHVLRVGCAWGAAARPRRSWRARVRRPRAAHVIRRASPSKAAAASHTHTELSAEAE